MQCLDCGTAFTRAQDLNRHQRAQHNGPQHSCGCGAAFVRKDALLRHERAKPQSCARWQARATSSPTRAESTSLNPDSGSLDDVSDRNLQILPLLPPVSDLEVLLDAYASRLWVLAAVHHLPTLKRRLFRLVETTNQTLNDYTACKLCPHTVRAVLWGSYIALDKRDEARTWGESCSSALFEWATRLELFDDPATTSASPAEILAFVKAGIIALLPYYISDLAEDGARLKEALVTAHRLSRFGTEARDNCYLPSTAPKGGGSETRQLPPRHLMVARDALDLAAWINAEERTRASCQLLAFAQTSAYLQGTSCSVHSGGYETSRGFVAGSYNATPLPCPDLLFRDLPPIPETEDEVLAWYSMDPASRTAHLPISYGEAVSWPDLPPGSPQRRRQLAVLFGNYLNNGWTRNMIIFAGSTLGRVVAYRDFCKVREWKLHDPPVGHSPDEMRARAMHDGLNVQIAEFLEALPESMRMANATGDGDALRALAVEHWGQDFYFGTCTPLVHWHGVAITLNSPRDLLGSVGYSLTADDLEWTKSHAFAVALSHALVSVRIITLAIPLLDAPQTAVCALVDENALFFNPLWPAIVFRIALVYVYCLRHLQSLATDPILGDWNPDVVWPVREDMQSPEFSNILVKDIRNCLESIGMAQNRKVRESFIPLAENVLVKLFGGLNVTKYEADTLRLLRRVDHFVV